MRASSTRSRSFASKKHFDLSRVLRDAIDLVAQSFDPFPQLGLNGASLRLAGIDDLGQTLVQSFQQSLRHGLRHQIGPPGRHHSGKRKKCRQVDSAGMPLALSFSASSM